MRAAASGRSHHQRFQGAVAQPARAAGVAQNRVLRRALAPLRRLKGVLALWVHARAGDELLGLAAPAAARRRGSRRRRRRRLLAPRRRAGRRCRGSGDGHATRAGTLRPCASPGRPPAGLVVGVAASAALPVAVSLGHVVAVLLSRLARQQAAADRTARQRGRGRLHRRSPQHARRLGRAPSAGCHRGALDGRGQRRCVRGRAAGGRASGTQLGARFGPASCSPPCIR